MSGTACPPRPRLTLRVGITGHRLNKLAAGDLDRLRTTLADVLEAVEAGLARVAGGPLAGLDDDAPPALTIVSPLAEGADRLAAEAAPAGWALAALLPMPRAEYERDFLGPGEATSPSLEAFRTALARAGTVTELPALEHDLSAPERRARQYAALGSVLVGHVDLLVAVWDGAAAAGPGGTALVVAEAASRGVPVIRVAPDGSGRATVSGATLDDAVVDRLLQAICAHPARHLPA